MPTSAKLKPHRDTKKQQAYLHGQPLPRFSKGGLKVYLVGLGLVDHATGEFTASLERLRQLTGLTLESVQKGLFELSDYEILKRIEPAVGNRAARYGFINWNINN